MPADFAFFDYDYEYWVPARFDAAFRGNRDRYFLSGLARLKPGVSVEQARTQLDTVMDAIRRDYPQYTQNATAAVAPLKDVLLDGVERRLVLLMGAAAFVLLIACANLGNLLLARAANRRREMAVRQALGAGHGRLVRQVLAESVWLAAVGRRRRPGARRRAAPAADDAPAAGPAAPGRHRPRPGGPALHGRSLGRRGPPHRRRPGVATRRRSPDRGAARWHARRRTHRAAARRPGQLAARPRADAAGGCRAPRPQLRGAVGRAARVRGRPHAHLRHVDPAGHVSGSRRSRRVLRTRRRRDRAAAGRSGGHADDHAAGGRPRQRRVVQPRRPSMAGRPDAAGRPQPRRARQLLRGDGHSAATGPHLHSRPMAARDGGSSS